jgi:hypothetical protein
MSSTNGQDDRTILEALGRLMKNGEERDDDGADAMGRARFVDAVSTATTRSRRRPEPRATFVVLAAALVTVLVLSVALFFPKRTVEYSIDGARAASGGFVQAPAEHGATVQFSDGSRVTLAGGARGRVAELRERGARFTVETGVAEVEVAKRTGGADYVFEAGPYSVRVTGTRFSISWDPATERLHVDLAEGAVVITGPQAEEGLGLRAGQVIDLDPSSVRLTEPHAPPTAAAASEAPDRATPDTPAPAPAGASAAPGSASSDHRAAAGPTWAERVATGDYEGVLAEADGRGIDATLASAGAGELMSLADAARYGGRSALAADALRAVRKRFPATRSASTAAFLLGRFAEDAGKPGAAITLYDATIAEGGAFASEAMGRKMVLVQRTRGDGGARAIAEQYLKTFPRGAYADAARAISTR